MFDLLNTDVSVEFDSYGNLYLINKSNGDCYQLNVNGKNEPYLEKGEYTVVDVNSVINKIKIVDDTIGKDKDELSKYFPEESEYIEYVNDEDEEQIVDEDNVKMFGDFNRTFNFGGTSTFDIPVKTRKFGDVSALYESYVYDSNSQLVFKSTSPFNDACYRLRIYQRGGIQFRPITDSNKLYIISKTTDNQLTLQSC